MSVFLRVTKNAKTKIYCSFAMDPIFTISLAYHEEAQAKLPPASQYIIS